MSTTRKALEDRMAANSYLTSMGVLCQRDTSLAAIVSEWRTNHCPREGRAESMTFSEFLSKKYPEHL